MELLTKSQTIAAALGWTDFEVYEDNQGPPLFVAFPPMEIGLDKSGEWTAIKARHKKSWPNYVNDYNAIYSAITTLKFSEKLEFIKRLQKEMSQSLAEGELVDPSWGIFASCEMKANAFLKTKNIWNNNW